MKMMMTMMISLTTPEVPDVTLQIAHLFILKKAVDNHQAPNAG